MPGAAATRRRPAPIRPGWPTVLAFAAVAVPFAVALGRLLAAPGAHLYLPDDLALIDLHTRRALAWHQQLGVFDRNQWNHPGPTYFYLLSLAYRALGSGAKALFVGATLLNALAALGCVWVVHRRATPARALWAALWICLLAALLATASPDSITYSEGPLGALVSPWNPMVVVFPLLLLVLLSAAAVDRSPLSLLGAALVGSFVVQTDVSTLPLAAAVGVAAAATAVVTAVADRRSATRGPARPHAPPDEGGWRPPAPAWRGRIWATAGGTLLVLLWVPPVVQQVTDHPGNLTLLYRFFTSGQPGQTLESSLWSVTAAFGVLVAGPGEIMTSLLGGTPHHVVASVAVAAGVVAAGALVIVVGVRQGRRFAAGLGALTLVGSAASLFAASRVVGFVFGYLMIWAVVVPVGACIAVGMVQGPRRWTRRPSAHVRPRSPATTAAVVVGTLTMAVAAVLTARIVALPALGAVSDPRVEHLVALVEPHLDRGDTVFVGDAGAGTGGAGGTRLLDTEEFIGLVNELDGRGYHPTVNRIWRAQFGPGYLSSGREPRQVELSTWTPGSAAMSGYAGRSGDIAVVVAPAPR